MTTSWRHLNRRTRAGVQIAAAIAFLVLSIGGSVVRGPGLVQIGLILAAAACVWGAVVTWRGK